MRLTRGRRSRKKNAEAHQHHISRKAARWAKADTLIDAPPMTMEARRERIEQRIKNKKIRRGRIEAGA